MGWYFVAMGDNHLSILNPQVLYGLYHRAVVAVHPVQITLVVMVVVLDYAADFVLFQQYLVVGLLELF